MIFVFDEENPIPQINGIAIIPLTQEKFAYIDLEDYERVTNKHSWHAEPSRYGRSWYARTCINYRKILLHRFILEIDDPNIKIDHINNNGLDNRKENLRVATSSQNKANMIAIGGTSKYKGVSYNKKASAWISEISYQNVKNYLGTYFSEKQAALAYNDAAKVLFGEFALLNDVTEDE